MISVTTDVFNLVLSDAELSWTSLGCTGYSRFDRDTSYSIDRLKYGIYTWDGTDKRHIETFSYRAFARLSRPANKPNPSLGQKRSKIAMEIPFDLCFARFSKKNTQTLKLNSQLSPIF